MYPSQFSLSVWRDIKHHRRRLVTVFLYDEKKNCDYYRDAGKAILKELGIKTIFDLRSDTEIQKYNTSSPTIDGVDIIHVPVFKTEDYTPEVMAQYVISV